MKLPSALGTFDQMMKAAKGKKIAVFLDYDGTLSPIVDDPDLAFMSNEVCCLGNTGNFFLCIIQRILKTCFGRCVQQYVKLQNIFQQR